MIKICALDLLNRETFETDVLSAEGKILCQKGYKITPQIILKLYFKEIFVNEPLSEIVVNENEDKNKEQSEE